MKACHFIVALALAATCLAGEDSGESRLLMFVDTTASLSPDQSASTANLARELLHKGRAYDSVAAYPVGSVGQAPSSMFDEDVRPGMTERRLQLRRWDLLLGGSLSKHKNDAHTCLLDTVEFASKQLATMKQPRPARIDLVFITDMIEDCQSKLLGSAIRLDKPSIKREAELARQFPTGRINLTNTHFYIVVPPESAARPSGPRLDDLEQFWRTFLSRCGLNPTDVTVSVSRLPPDVFQD